jgi:Concanavalin A-like lectin/glucanases superfamily/Fibronectin type III domain
MRALRFPFIIFLILFFTGCSKPNEPPPVTLPIAPNPLTAQAVSTSEINLSWTDNSTNEDGFVIERKTSTTNYTAVANLGKDITSYRDLGLSKNTTYTYRVYSFNTAGKSLAYSNEAEATTADDLPAAATNLAAAAVSFDQIDLTWVDNASNESGYKLERKSGAGVFAVITTLAANANGYSDKGLSEMTEYTYRVYPYNPSGNGPNSNDAKATTSADITTGLAAHFAFAGNVLDSSGNNNSGTLNGNVTLTTDRFGVANRAYLFDGSPGSFINVPMSNSLKIQKQITISAWIYMNAGSLNPRVISNEASGFDQYYMSVAGSANTSRNLEAAIQGASGGSGFCCGGANGIDVPALSWHFITFTVDANGLAKLYLDGELKKSSQGTLQTNPNYGPNLNIGRNSYPAFDAWGGKLDEIRIYNRALTQGQVSYLAGR